jgi:hypothetical protein
LFANFEFKETRSIITSSKGNFPGQSPLGFYKEEKSERRKRCWDVLMRGNKQCLDTRHFFSSSELQIFNLINETFLIEWQKYSVMKA